MASRANLHGALRFSGIPGAGVLNGGGHTCALRAHLKSFFEYKTDDFSSAENLRYHDVAVFPANCAITNDRRLIAMCDIYIYISHVNRPDSVFCIANDCNIYL